MKTEVEKAFTNWLQWIAVKDPESFAEIKTADDKIVAFQAFKITWAAMNEEQRANFMEPIFNEQLAHIKELARSASRETPITPTPADLDPKGEIGKTKCPLHLIPPQAMEETAHVHALGAHKYGPFNWRTNKVCATTYISAMMRHLNAWRGGEDNDPESGRSHLAHIAANCFILMDAALFGKLVDDRAK